MRKSVIFGMSGLLVLAAVPAYAVMLKNMDKNNARVTVVVGGKRNNIVLQPNQAYDTGKADAAFIIGNERGVGGIIDERFIVENGRIVPDQCVKYRSEQIAEEEAKAKEMTGKQSTP